MGANAVFNKFTISLLIHLYPEIRTAPFSGLSIISPNWVSYFAWTVAPSKESKRDAKNPIKIIAVNS
jgi:hypothetical protein